MDFILDKEFVPFQIYEIRGKASRDLEHPLNALTYLERAEQSLKEEPVTPRWHAVLDISKGQAYCDAVILLQVLTWQSVGLNSSTNAARSGR